MALKTAGNLRNCFGRCSVDPSELLNMHKLIARFECQLQNCVDCKSRLRLSLELRKIQKDASPDFKTKVEDWYFSDKPFKYSNQP